MYIVWKPREYNIMIESNLLSEVILFSLLKIELKSDWNSKNLWVSLMSFC